MAVLLDTSMGELVIDLFVNECPIASTNFLKLCKIKYYNGCLFYNVQANFIAQTGDPTGTGKGGKSVYGIIEGNSKHVFRDEINKQRKLNKVGLVVMAHTSSSENSNKSQFFITLRSEDYHDFEGIYTILGEVAEGMDVLEKLNEIYCDEDGRPYQDVRIRHTAILDDPFPDPSGLIIPDASPDREYPEDEKVKRRLRYEDDLNVHPEGKTETEIDQSIKRKEAQSRAIVLEMTGDLPDAEAKPPVEVLFICKLNPVTRDEDLELIFSRFGVIKSCEIIRDFKTGDSLNYAFIEFDSETACIEAYDKMNNVLIDDRRIKVDFSQSVSHLWNKFKMQPRNNTKSKSMSKTMTTSTSSAAISSKPNIGDKNQSAKHNHHIDHHHDNRDQVSESKKRPRSRSGSRNRHHHRHDHHRQHDHDQSKTRHDSRDRKDKVERDSHRDHRDRDNDYGRDRDRDRNDRDRQRERSTDRHRHRR